MEKMTAQEIAAFLAASHQGVLSVSRVNRGPIAVPMSFLYAERCFRMITSPTSEHGALMVRTGRATITVHHDEYPHGTVIQRYVTAEGAVEFTDEPPLDLLRAILLKDRGPRVADQWLEHMAPQVDTVAVLTPDKISGYLFHEELPEPPD